LVERLVALDEGAGEEEKRDSVWDGAVDSMRISEARFSHIRAHGIAEKESRDAPFLFFPLVTVTVTTGSSSSPSSALASSSSSPSVKLEGVTIPPRAGRPNDLEADPAGVEFADPFLVELAGVGREAGAAERRGGMITDYCSLPLKLPDNQKRRPKMKRGWERPTEILLTFSEMVLIF